MCSSDLNSTAYAICDKDTIVGLVIVRDRPEADNRYYSFTELFVADDFLGKGYGNQAVEARKSFMKIMVL